ncbi:helix-turn-helix domain-containing protein [Streptomyces sp. MMG1121]|uniref:helix-turn-helix domain-containing protein n=1 Tax=Streptomyces sp. MMG1121 TaxID=1415544 RepID=UPI00099D92BA|nr:helix-turn-helix domain-containing protein [Streptomyces sp. MMG1121]
MSDTTDQLTGLSPAVIHVYIQLVAFTDPARVDDIAQAAETARSSAFKALVSLEKRGLAHRERGIQNGPSRCPDLWRATHNDPGHAPEEPLTGQGPDQPITGAVSPGGPVVDTSDPTPNSHGPTAHSPAQGSGASELGQAVSSVPLPAQCTESAESASPVASPDGAERLARGGLRRLVIDHLNAHPGEAFTATKISRMIGRSSGAIANALVALTNQGLAERITDRPRAYRAVFQEPTS